ncbi:uncharacterized protein BDZ99DRAFT_359032, partial [Mytilinidion resinicola]
QYARDYGLPYDRLLRAYHGGNSRSTRPPINQVLDEAQELALEQFLDHIERISFGIRHRQVVSAANAISSEAYEYDDPPVVGINWDRRWLKKHAKYNKIVQKPMDIQRKQAQQPARIAEWYAGLYAWRGEWGILDEDIWNFDESGVCI